MPIAIILLALSAFFVIKYIANNGAKVPVSDSSGSEPGEGSMAQTSTGPAGSEDSTGSNEDTESGEEGYVYPLEVRTKEIVSSEGEEGKLVFRFLNDNQIMGKWGDACFIRFPNGETMMIDAGHSAVSKAVVELLKMSGVTKIDYLVASHDHGDHIGGFSAIAENFEIGKIYTSVYGNKDKVFENVKSKTGAKRYYLMRGDSLDIGEVHIDILHPSFDVETYRKLKEEDRDTTENIRLANNNSLVMKFTYGESTALFVGDLYVPGETEMVKEYGDELKADLLKIPHHGESTSHSEEFVKAVSAKVAVATGGVKMSLFHHARYKNAGTEVFQSYFDGCVKVTMDKTGGPEVITEKDRTSEYYY